MKGCAAARGTGDEMSTPPQYPGGEQPQQPYGEQPQQPSYGASDQQAWGSQPSYGSGEQPSYGSADQSAYGAADQQGWSAQPSYGSADQPSYGSAEQPAYGSANPPAYGSANPDPFTGGQTSASAPFAPVGGAPGMPPNPPKKRGWIWLVVGCGVLALIGLLVLGGCTIFLATSGDDTAGGDETTTAAPVEEETTEETVEETTPAEEETPAEDATTPAAPAGDAGTSRENPLPKDSTVSLESEGGTTSVTLGEVNWDANAAIAEANQFNEPAPEGQTYVIVPVTVSYAGSGSITPWLEASITFVAADGRSYDQSFVVLDNDLMMQGDLYDGGTVTGNIAFLVPQESVGSGVFAIQPLISYSTDQVFVSAA